MYIVRKNTGFTCFSGIIMVYVTVTEQILRDREVDRKNSSSQV